MYKDGERKSVSWVILLFRHIPFYSTFKTLILPKLYSQILKIWMMKKQKNCWKIKREILAKLRRKRMSIYILFEKCKKDFKKFLSRCVYSKWISLLCLILILWSYIYVIYICMRYVNIVCIHTHIYLYNTWKKKTVVKDTKKIVHVLYICISTV